MGLEVASQINFKYQLNKCYYNLSDVYDRLGDYKNSFHYYKLYIEGKEKIYSEESKQTIAELQAKYQDLIYYRTIELIYTRLFPVFLLFFLE